MQVRITSIVLVHPFQFDIIGSLLRCLERWSTTIKNKLFLIRNIQKVPADPNDESSSGSTNDVGIAQDH